MRKYIVHEREIRRWLQHPDKARNLQKLWVRTGADSDPKIRYLIARARACQVPVQYVPPVWMEREGLPPSTRVVTVLSPVQFMSVEDLLDHWGQSAPASDRAPLVIVDRVTDQHNLGAIFRMCYAFSCLWVLLHERSSTLSEGALQASAGAFSHLHFSRFSRPRSLCEVLAHRNIPVVATTHLTHPPEGVLHCYLPEFSWREKSPLALVVGSEHRGVSEVFLRNARVWLSIPASPEFSVLNVAGALGIILYDWYRSVRWRGKSITDSTQDKGERAVTTG